MKLLLDLLEIDNKDSYIEIAKIIESNSEKKIQAYHQYSFIFEWYQMLLNWKIEPEDFLQLWDFQSKINFDKNKDDSISFLKSNPKLQKDTIYIFDSISKWIIPESENIYYC